MVKKVLMVMLLAMLLLAGCAGRETASTDAAGEEGEAPRPSLLQEGQVFAAEWGEPLGDLLLMPGEYFLTEDEIFYLAYDYDPDGQGVSCSHILKKGQGQEPVEFQSLEKEYISLLFTDLGGNVYSLSSTVGEEVPHMRKWSPEGTRQYDAAVSFQGIPGAGQAPAGAGSQEEAFLTCKDHAVTREGKVVLSDAYGVVYLLDEAGCLTNVIPDGAPGMEAASGYGLAGAGEEAVYFYCLKEKGFSICSVDFQEGSLGEAVEVGMETAPAAVYSGPGEGLLILEGDSLWLYKTAGGELERLAAWDNEYVGIRPEDIEGAALTQENEIALLVQDQYLQEPRRVKLVQREESELPEVQTVTVGVVTGNSGEYNTEWYQKTAQEFHRIYPAYRLEVKTYGTDGMDFETDLLKGEGPDLMDLEYLDTKMLAAQGILEDLTPYLEGGDVKKEDILPSVLEAGTVNGKLVRLAESMSIQGLVAGAGSAGKEGWTPEDFLGMIEANPGVPYSWSPDKNGLLYLLLCVDMDEYIDWEKKECHFQDEEFIKLLESVGEADLGNPLAFSPFQAVPFRNHEVLTAEVGIGRWDSYLELKEAFGEDAEFLGYPNKDGEPRYRMVTSYSFGMNSASQRKDGAWAFLEMLLSEEYQENFVNTGFPVREDVLEKQFRSSLHVNVRTRMNPYDGLMYDGDLREATEEDLDFVRYMIGHAVFGGNNGETVYRIIAEETGGYFAGDKDAAQTAEVIQKRVNLYLNE